MVIFSEAGRKNKPAFSWTSVGPGMFSVHRVLGDCGLKQPPVTPVTRHESWLCYNLY